MAVSLLSRGYKCRVSSVLNKDTKQFGKEKMFDGTEESCWNSHQGLPQFVVLQFDAPVNVDEICIMFQGGFVGQNAAALITHNGSTETEIIPFSPLDNNHLQVSFPMMPFVFFYEWKTFKVKSDNVSQLKIEFKESSDFFGRVTIYKLDVLGSFP